MIRVGGAIQTSVLVSTEFYKLCKQHSIHFSEALRVGISVLLAERDIIPYDNNLNLYRKMLVYRQKAEEALQKISEMESKK